MSLALRGTRRRCNLTILMASRRISTRLLKSASSGASGKAATKMVVKPYWITEGCGDVTLCREAQHPRECLPPVPTPSASPPVPAPETCCQACAPQPHPRTHLHELIEQAKGVDWVQEVVALPVPELGVLGCMAQLGPY